MSRLTLWAGVVASGLLAGSLHVLLGWPGTFVAVAVVIFLALIVSKLDVLIEKCDLGALIERGGRDDGRGV